VEGRGPATPFGFDCGLEVVVLAVVLDSGHGAVGVVVVPGVVAVVVPIPVVL
jgi:hypothetical protein